MAVESSKLVVVNCSSDEFEDFEDAEVEMVDVMNFLSDGGFATSIPVPVPLPVPTSSTDPATDTPVHDRASGLTGNKGATLAGYIDPYGFEGEEGVPYDENSDLGYLDIQAGMNGEGALCEGVAGPTQPEREDHLEQTLVPQQAPSIP